MFGWADGVFVSSLDDVGKMVLVNTCWDAINISEHMVSLSIELYVITQYVTEYNTTAEKKPEDAMYILSIFEITIMTGAVNQE